MFDQLSALLGPANVLTGEDAEPYGWDWGHESFHAPLAVVRPGSTAEVSEIVKWANATATPLIPLGGRTGMAGGGQGEGALIVSLERMNRIRDLRPSARSIVVEAGVIIANIHDAVDAQGLIFPLFFGARGSAMIGGALATNAGGSNVLRYGNTRDLVLGIEAVLPNGEVIELMHDLHKNNSGYDLRHLLIGSEGTLGIITGAVLRLFPKPGAYATALVGMKSLTPALDMLNRIQLATGGAVEAFEFMPDTYVTDYLRLRPEARAPFEVVHKVNILIEIGALSPRDCIPLADGSVPILSYLEAVLAEMHEAGLIEDAQLATSQAHRAQLWAIREAASEVAAMKKPMIIMDVAVPVDRMEAFISQADSALEKLDPEATTSIVAHLGDGNIHYTMFPSKTELAHKDILVESIEDVVSGMNGSFSAEHGIGTHKLSSMARRKDPVALAAMRAIKAALDPKGIMNPGKLLPLESP